MNLQQSQQHFSILEEKKNSKVSGLIFLVGILVIWSTTCVSHQVKNVNNGIDGNPWIPLSFFFTHNSFEINIFLRQFINIPEKRLTFSESNGFFFQKKCLKERLLRDKTYTKYRIWYEKKAFRISNLFQGKEWLFFCCGPKQIIIVRLVLFCFISFA